MPYHTLQVELIVRYWLKITNFTYPHVYLVPPLGWTLLEPKTKTKIPRLPATFIASCCVLSFPSNTGLYRTDKDRQLTKGHRAVGHIALCRPIYETHMHHAVKTGSIDTRANRLLALMMTMTLYL